ncbi:MAG: type IV pilus assembly protein PilM [Akkermansiaceae bacterium]|nr:type IV pilus assembly protein PilM [Akkermansiaceae bacterium]
MVDKQTIVALNIGSQRIGMAVFEPSKTGGLVLKAYDFEEIMADPALDAARIGQTRIAISDLAERLGIENSRARYAIAGHAVFTRFVKLPPIQQDNIDQLVTFEAQQHVPFPLNEVVWDYELIEGGAEQEAVIVAIKSDALDEINSSVNDGGLETTEVDVAPMALYNSFRAEYGVPEEPTLLIDIGAKTSDLIYVEGNRFFTRSIPIGGMSVTAAIAKEYGVPYAEAEKQKVTNGLVALGGGHTEQLDEAVAALAMVIRNAMSRLPAEIARTTNYYRSQHGGSAPRRIMIAGGGANLPYTLEFFREKLNLPVEYFNPVRHLTLAKDVSPEVIQAQGHTMGELVGLGLRGAGKSKIHIDLVPSVVEQARADERRKPILIAAAAVLLGGMLIWALMNFVAASTAQNRKESLVDQAQKLEPEFRKLTQALKRENKLRDIASPYVQAENDRVFWFDLLNELNGAFASDAIWLTDFELVTGFDPARRLSGEEAINARNPNGQDVVSEGFAQVNYGMSALAALREDSSSKPRASRGRAKPEPPTVNAVRIRGYWRDNPRSQDVVSDRLKLLQEKSENFDFMVENPDRKAKEPINLTSDQYIGKILTVSAVAVEEGDLAMPFEIILPLARKVEFK